MRIKTKKVLAGFAAAITVLALSSAVSAPAMAAGDPPQDAVIKLISPVLTEENTSEAAVNQALADQWVKNEWFGSGLVYQKAFVPTGSTITLVYHVTDKNGKITRREAQKHMVHITHLRDLHHFPQGYCREHIRNAGKCTTTSSAQ